MKATHVFSQSVKATAFCQICRAAMGLAALKGGRRGGRRCPGLGNALKCYEISVG